jgi:Flp pilus assembly protein TadG
MWQDRKPSGSKGQGLVEFALVFPIIVVLLLGLVDLGRAAYAYSTLSNAARTGSRVAIVDQYRDLNGLYKAQNVAAAQAVGINIPADTVAISWLKDDLSAACSPLQIGCVAEVTVGYTFSAITPIIGALVGPITMTNTTRLPVERVYCAVPQDAPCNYP